VRTALVTGACGLLGQHLVRRLRTEYKVFAVDIAPNIFEDYSNITYKQCDLADSTSARQVLSEFSPDVIYNCAAHNDVDGCEDNRDKAYELNVGLVENLVNSGCERIIHFSTDYVFNGKYGPYDEDDETDPIGYYGKTKLQSENIMLESDRHYLIIRTNVLFGGGVNVRPNFISWLLENFKRGKRSKIATDQYNNPIHADNLAEASIEAEKRGLTGILHIGGGSYFSRYEIACWVAERFGFHRDLIIPVLTSELGQIARRPMRGGLKIDRAEKLLKVPLLTFKEALKDLNT
jgi:dTDP-4-dehydrorhamnose reductase